MTLVFTYYEAPLMLLKQLEYWLTYPDGVSIVLVDDGSPNSSALDTLVLKGGILSKGLRVSLRVFRVKEDILNNVGGARNLAFTVAPDGWVWNLDIDTVVPVQSLCKALKMRLDSSRFYVPARYRVCKDERIEEINSHEGTFLITREAFWELGGFNEDYVQYYYDGACYMFRQKLRKKMERVVLKDVWTLYFSSAVIPDSNPLGSMEKKRNPYPVENSNGSRNCLRFDWEQVL